MTTKGRPHECEGIARSVSQYGTCQHCGDCPTGPTPQREPSVKTMERWMNDGVAKATDGCRVEPDGTCPHGQPSWLLKLGLI